MKKQLSAPSEPTTEAHEFSTDDNAFESLGLSGRILDTLADLGFVQPTPIQEGAIPPLLEGKDLVGQARTGTGKTAAFGLPMITRLLRKAGRGMPRGLVLTPTRELALQVTEALIQFAAGSSLRFLTVYGGSAYGPQLRGLRDGVDVVVGTPGRVIDLIERGNLQLGEVEIAVLDEADEMLEMGFIEAVETILAKTPATKQVALFSATMPAPIHKVAERYLKDPINIKDSSQTVLAIEQRYVQVPPRFKREALLRILRSEDRGATLVFASTRISCAEAADFLAVNGIPAEPLHGDLSQPARERVIELLRARRVEVVVATDIAARGIDIEHLTHIINLDLPKNVAIYTHRIGRTGRAGRSGKAITLVVPRESLRFADTLRKRGVQIEEMFIASEHELATRQRLLAVEELKASLTGPTAADAKQWLADICASGLAIEDVAAGALAVLGEAKNLRLGQSLEKGLPPWARSPQPGAKPMAAKFDPKAKRQRDEMHVEQRDDRGARGDERPRDDRPRGDERPRDDRPRGDDRPRDDRGPQPTGEGFVIIGVGRNDNVRPADLVGALTNELGLTGRDIGRVEIRESASVIGVPAAFAARLGEDAWPLTIRRIETTLRRHDEPIVQRPHRREAPAPRYDAPPARLPWSPHDAPRRANAEEPRGLRYRSDERGPRNQEVGPRSERPRVEETEQRPHRARTEAPVERQSPAPAFERPALAAAPAVERPVLAAAPAAERPALATAPATEDRQRDARPEAADDRPHRARVDAKDDRPHRARGDAKDDRPHRARIDAKDDRPHRARVDAKDDRPHRARVDAKDDRPHRARVDAKDDRPHRARVDAKDDRAPRASAERPARAHERATPDDRRATPDTRRPSAPTDTRRPTKRPPTKSLADRAPRRAVDVAPRARVGRA